MEQDDLTIEELLRDVDVRGNPGVFWTIVGAVSVLSLFVIGEVWRLYYRIRR
jgi:hypothetical protein